MFEISTNIKNKISLLQQIEVLLGNLPNEIVDLRNLQKKITEENYHLKYSQLEEQSEIIFKEICKELVTQNFSFEQISNFINNELNCTNSLKYCNTREVEETCTIIPLGKA